MTLQVPNGAAASGSGSGHSASWPGRWRCGWRRRRSRRSTTADAGHGGGRKGARRWQRLGREAALAASSLCQYWHTADFTDLFQRDLEEGGEVRVTMGSWRE